MAEHGEIFWNECNVCAEKMEQAKAFYAGVMGWEISEGPMPSGEGTYTIAKRGEQMVAGMFPLEGPHFEGIPSHWMTYLTVANLDEAKAKAIELGGEIINPLIDIEGVARFAIVKDAGGAVVGLAEPK